MEKLKPCPFCGGALHIWKQQIKPIIGKVAECDKCGVRISIPWALEEFQAVEFLSCAWTTLCDHGSDSNIFRTDDADKYKHIEDECRRMIGHEKPTVDAVQVVRCGECKYWDRSDPFFFNGVVRCECKRHENEYWTADGFCSDAERNDSEIPNS